MSSRRPTILAYHAIAHLTNDPNETATSPKRFESQMLYLRRHNLRGVSVRELRRAISRGNGYNLVGLTFDDGYEDFLHTALPVLESVGFSATVFVVAGMLGGENNWEHVYEPRPRMRILRAEDIREVSERGIEVGSHSMTHPRLSSMAPKLVDREVNDSRRILGEILGEKVEGFSYPYGSLTDATLQAVRRAEYAYACAWNPLREWGDYDLPRIPVFERDGPLRFAAKVKAYWQYSRIVRRR